MSKKSFYLIYSILLILDLFQVYTDGSFRFVTKPLIMSSLIIWYVMNYKSLKEGVGNGIFLFGLLAGLGGDIFLLFDSMFIYGLASFLLMQIAYSIVFYKDREWTTNTYIYGTLLSVLIISVAFLLWNQLGQLKIPVLVYMGAIGVMSLTAFSRNRSLKGYLLVFLGTILFVISDTALGIHQFDAGINLGKITVMLTYGLAQLFIVSGYLSGSMKA